MTISQEVLDIFNKYYSERFEGYTSYTNIMYKLRQNTYYEYEADFSLWCGCYCNNTEKIKIYLIDDIIKIHYKYDDKLLIMKENKKKIDENTIVLNRKILTEDEQEIMKKYFYEIIKKS
jgi:hypothetical protein